MISNKNRDNGKGFDWGLASKEYSAFRIMHPFLI